MLGTKPLEEWGVGGGAAQIAPAKGSRAWCNSYSTVLPAWQGRKQEPGLLGSVFGSVGSTA